MTTSGRPAGPKILGFGRIVPGGSSGIVRLYRLRLGDASAAASVAPGKGIWSRKDASIAKGMPYYSRALARAKSWLTKCCAARRLKWERRDPMCCGVVTAVLAHFTGREAACFATIHRLPDFPPIHQVDAA